MVVRLDPLASAGPRLSDEWPPKGTSAQLAFAGMAALALALAVAYGLFAAQVPPPPLPTLNPFFYQ